MFEPQPLYDAHNSFYGKANAENGMRHALKSYGTVVAQVTPISACDTVPDVSRVEIGMEYLSATTLRHVKEFLAQTDDAFRGITLPWLRKAIRDGREIEGAESAWRKVYVLKEL